MNTSADHTSEAETDWFRAHYDTAAREIIDFLAEDGISLTGMRVADVGCGDGIIDLGLVHKAQPANLTGFDVRPTGVDALRSAALGSGLDGEIPSALVFRTSAAKALPAEDGSFDCVVTWSTFEHVEDPPALLGEIARILRSDRGVLFLQLWPFYHSAHGSHLWSWFPDGWAHLRDEPSELEQFVREHPDMATPEWTDARLEDFRTLNRITIHELQAAIETAGMKISKVQLLGGSVHTPKDLDGYSIVDLAIDGIKLIAVRWPPTPLKEDDS